MSIVFSRSTDQEEQSAQSSISKNNLYKMSVNATKEKEKNAKGV